LGVLSVLLYIFTTKTLRTLRKGTHNKGKKLILVKEVKSENNCYKSTRKKSLYVNKCLARMTGNREGRIVN